MARDSAMLKWDLLPKEKRQELRKEMMQEMVRILRDEDPSIDLDLTRKKASQAVNQAIWRERQNNKSVRLSSGGAR